MKAAGSVSIYSASIKAVLSKGGGFNPVDGQTLTH